MKKQIEAKDFAKKHGLRILISIARAVLFILLAFVVIYPFFTKITSMFMTSEDVYDLSVSYIPKHFTFDNVKKAAELLDIGKSFFLSLEFVTVVALLEMVSCTLVGYGLARFKFKLATPLLIIAVVGLVLPPIILQIPLYTLFRNFRLFGLIPLINGGEGISFINTQIPSIFLAATASGFRCGLYILIMRQYYRTMPAELEEAAYIDGAGPFGAFVRIMVPSSVTMMITVFLFAFVWTWLDSDFVPNFMGETEVLSNMVMGLNGQYTGGAADEVTRNLIAYAGILFLIVPLLILYAFTQRFFVQSVERSGLVG